MASDLDRSALIYHRKSPAGKLAVAPTKPMATQRDLALAYSPGVAAACREIMADPGEVSTLTARANLVGVVTNGTAVLGLGNIGALAGKPVMEGKAVLFKKFSGIDVFDIEVDELDPDRFVEVVAALEPTFGGINLEDIKAPECFEIERQLRERMNIPVFHDDQHGTAIVTAAAVLNGLEVVGKNIGEVRLVASGAGAAALACLDLLVSLGLPRDHITVVDRKGVIHAGRPGGLDQYKGRYARQTQRRSLADAVAGTDIFLGLSSAGLLKPGMVESMNRSPLILALANPMPEILPEQAKAVRSDVIMATGRSDYPNQVNNVLCFPFIFRGALDVGATTINEAMKVACVNALCRLARAEESDLVAKAYLGESQVFGPEYLIPKPFDPRLILEVAPAVASAAMESGVATRPLEDLDAYRRRLEEFVFRSGRVMEPVFERARRARHRLVYCEGEERRVLQAAQQVVDEGIAQPILIGRPDVVATRIKELGLRLRLGHDYELTNPQSDDRFREYWTTYQEIMGRQGVSPGDARTTVRTQNTVIGAIMLRRGEAESMICGSEGRFADHVRHVKGVIGTAPGISDLSALSVMILPTGTFFLCDTHITADPSAQEIAEMAMLASREVRRFGITPKVALVSHSNFGASNTVSARKMRAALALLREYAPDLEADGEMHVDAALAADIRERVLPDARLDGQANLLIFPNLDAAHNTYAALKVLGGGVSIGPILVGAAQPVHVVTHSITVRGLVNMSALAVAETSIREQQAAAN
jgi:malate dehydrogenase (oxaloacetate-decarboxylating)(NADP+)